MKNKLRILFVNYSKYGEGGASFSTNIIANELKKRGHFVAMASLSKYPDLPTFLMKDFRNIPLFFLRDWYVSNFLLRIIKKEKIDLIHCADGRLTLRGSVLASKKKDVKIILNFRDYWFCCLRGSLLNNHNKICSGMKFFKCLRCMGWHRFPWEIYKYFYFKKRILYINQANSVVAVSGVVKKKLIETGSREDIEIVNNPVLLQKENGYKKVKNDFKNFTQKIDGSKTVVTYIGKIQRQKGIKTILKVASEISKTRSDILFLLIGSGDLADYCFKYIENNKIKNIILGGQVSHDAIEEVYAKSDFIFLPSIGMDTFSRSVIESMAHKKAVIASNLGGNLEIIKDGENGFLVDPHNIKMCIDLIIKLTDNKKTRLAIAEKAYFRILNLRVGNIADSFEKIYFNC